MPSPTSPGRCSTPMSSCSCARSAAPSSRTPESAMSHAVNRLDEPSRRDFLARSAQAFLGVSCLSLLGGGKALAGDPQPAVGAATRPTAKNCIYFYLAGGMSHLDTFDPKPGAETQGPTKAIKTKADGIQISEYLPELSEHMNHLAVIRG